MLLITPSLWLILFIECHGSILLDYALGPIIALGMSSSMSIWHTSAFEVEIFPSSSLHLKSIVIPLDISVSVHSFLWSGGPPIDIISPKNVTLMHLKWHLFLFTYIFSSGIAALLVSGFCHGPCHWYHALQLEYHVLWQICFAGLWRLHQFSFGTCCLVVLL